jgi:hypothetical protein
MLVLRRHLQALTRPPALLAAVALVAYLAAAIGFPLPARPGAAGCCAGACGCPAEEQARASCCCAPAKRAPKRPNCCQRQAKGDAGAPREATLRWVIGEQQQRCRGLATVWLSVGAALPPPPPVQLSLEQPACGLVVIEPDRATILPRRPPLPPPRAVGAGTRPPSPVSTGERSAL